MGVFGKSFFSFPPSDPEEPGFAQDGNRSLKEAHSTGKEISEFLSNYDDETITSLDGKKYQVMASREGGAATESWWNPTLDLKKMKLKIAQGLVTAPWDDTSSGTDDKLIHPKDSWRNFYFPSEAAKFHEETLSEGENYFYVKATFTKREVTKTTVQSIPNCCDPGEDGYGTGPHIISLGILITGYYLTESEDIEIVSKADPTEIEEEDSDLIKHQYLGHYKIESGKVKEHSWRVGHAIDFRMPIITTGAIGGSPSGPTDPNA